MKGEKVKLKEYNAIEMRFLQILVSKTLYADLLRYNYNLLMDRIAWKGDNVIMGHPDDKLTFIQTRKPRPDILDDYIDSFKHAIKAFKKHDIPKGKVIWSDELKPVIVRPDFIALDEEKEDE